MVLTGRWELLNGMNGRIDTRALDLYVSETLRWNKSIRLIGPKNEDGAAVQVIDSLLPFKHAKVVFPLLDIGSGAGLPAIPLAILNPEGSITCMEPDTKRASFLRHAARLLSLHNVKVVCEKAEEALRADKTLRAHFKTVTARAVSDVETLLKWAKPYLAPDGKVILGRGPDKIDTPRGWALLEHFGYDGHHSTGERSVAVFSCLDD